MCQVLPVVAGAHAATNPFNHNRNLQSGSCFHNEETESWRKAVAHFPPASSWIFARLGMGKAWEQSLGLLTPSPVSYS